MAFSDPIVDTVTETIQITGIKSLNYVEGSDGWRIGADGNAQFSNINLIGDIGATNGNFDDVLIGGESFNNDILPTLTDCVGYYERTTSSGTMNQQQERSIIAGQFDAIAGYTYQFITSGLRLRATVRASPVDMAARIRYTTNGTTPDLTSTILGQSVGCALNDIGTSVSLNRLYVPSVNCTVKFLITVASVQSVNNVAENFVSSDFPCQVWVNQLGPTAIFGADSSLFSGGGGSPGTPTTTTTKTYNATFAGAYRQNNQPTGGADVLFSGYGDSFNGIQKSLVGFPYATIQSDLTGATVNSIFFKFKVQHTWLSSGSVLYIGTHIYTTEPGTWGSGNVNDGRLVSGTIKAGGTYQVPLGGSIAADFKSGAARGISLGPPPSTANLYYNYLYNSASLLQLIINYTK